MDLLAFRKQPQVDATQEEIAAATGLPQSTISRIETREIKRPRFDVIRALQEWADSVARRKRLPMTQRLTWEHLGSPESPAPEADRAAG